MNRASIPLPETQPADRVLEIVTELVREAHPGRSRPVTLESSLERELELDSLARVELMLRVGQAFGVEVPPQVLSEVETPRDVLRFLGQAPAQPRTPHVDIALGGAAGDVPAQAQTLLDALEWHVARQPDRVHIMLHNDAQDEEAISYRTLYEEAKTISAGLVAAGLQPRQTVALMLPTGRDYLAGFFGVMLAGAIPVPIYPPARLAQIADHLKRHAHILSNAEAALIITVAQAKEVAMMLRAAVPSLTAIVTPEDLRTNAPAPFQRYRANGSDIAFLQYTSGSTGDPKGVVLTHANLLANIRALGEATQVVPERDVFVSWLPLYHDMGLISAWFGSLYYGMPLVLMSPLAFLAKPACWLQAISRRRGTISGAPNFAYELCTRNIPDAALDGLDLSSWRLAFNGAEPVNPATMDAFAVRFAACGLRREALSPVYGLAENSVGLTIPPLGRGPLIDRIQREPFLRENRAVEAAASDKDAIAVPVCGRPLPGHEVRVLDPHGQALSERMVGRLEFRGPSATGGYYRNPEATSKLLHDGWLDSGDHAYLLRGEVCIVGRVKDVIIRGGRNFYPYDLEAAVGVLPGIRKGCVAVFASPDRAAGTERLVIMAETRERDEAARAALRQSIGATALDVIGSPADDIVLVPPHTVLKTSSGKIRRLANRDLYERGEAGKPVRAPWMQSLGFLAAAVWARITLVARRSASLAYGCYAWAAFIALAVPAGGLAAGLQRPALGRRIARGAARALCRLLRMRLRAEGLDRLPATPHVLLVNHASYLDAVVLTALLPARPGYAFVAKRELARQPLLRAVLDGLGTIYVERFDAARSTQDFELMVAALAAGQNLLVFPEGTFHREPGLRPFHAGAFLAAVRAGVPVAVGALRGTRTLLRAGMLLPQHGAVEFEAGAVLTPPGDDWSAAARMSAAARKTMAPLAGEFDSLA